MKRFRDLPIKHKLILGSMATSVVVVLLTSAAAFFCELIGFRNAAVRELASKVQIIGANSASALAFQDPQAAQETLAALATDPEIVVAAIYAADGSLFAKYLRAGTDRRWLPGPPAAEAPRFMFGHLAFSRRIVLGGETVGTIYVRTDLRQHHARLHVGAAIVLASLVVACFIAFFMSAKLQQAISGPILELARVAQGVTHQKDYALRAQRSSRDETGLLVDAFNQMLAEIQRNDEALRNSEERLQAILDNSTAVIYLKDTDGRYLLINSWYETLFKITRKAIIGKTDTEIFRGPTAETFRANDLKVMAAGRALQFEEVATGEDGPHTYLSVKFPLFADGRAYAVCGISTDITERKRLEEQLIQAEKMESVGRLAAGVAHEVKNPLMTIALGVDYLTHVIGSGNDEATSVLRDMTDAVERANSVIHGLLDFSSQRRVRASPEDINLLLEHALGLVRHELAKNHITLVRELGTALPPLSLDKNKIAQVFVNLFMNAIHAMPGGGTLTVRTYRTDPTRPAAGDPASPAEGNGQITVEIDDTGTGIPPDKLAKVFDPFFTTKPPGQGTGLGLSVVRQIVQLHGARIQLNNRDGGGVRASLVFPHHK